MSLYQSTYDCNASLVQTENPLPQFRDRNTNFTVINSKEVPQEYSRLLGFECGKRVYPYKKQDGYDRNCKKTSIPSIILENEYLIATFLPTLGGRLISLFDKEENKELLFANKNIQMGNLAIRDAWFSGGIEWNIGQYGHSLTTSDNVFASAQKDSEGNDFLRIYEFERMHEVYWHVDFHLPKNSKMLFVKATVHNLKDEDTSLYCWTNGALVKTEHTRVFSNNRNALFLNPFLKDNQKGYDFVTIPDVDKLPGLDTSYPQRFPYSNEYFFCSNHSKVPYEITIEKDGSGFFDVSTDSLGYRKMFCWGEQPGGQHWEAFLSPGTKGEYFEAQAGAAPSQLHGEILKANSSFSFTQAFGKIKVDPNVGHNTDYAIAHEGVKKTVNDQLEKLSINIYEQDKKFDEYSLIAPEKILNKGSGFGYLQCKKENLNLPPAFKFDSSDIKESEKLYQYVLENQDSNIGVKDINKTEFVPASWLKIIKESDNVFSKYYDGIIEVETFNEDSALKKFIELEKENSFPLICRNIAQIYVIKKDYISAYEWYEKAISLTKDESYKYIVEEYSHLLINNKEFEKEKILLSSLDENILKESDGLTLDRAIIAARNQDLDTLHFCLFNRELANIREGENPFPYLYFEYKALEEAKEKGIEVTDEIREEVKKKYKVPFDLDFTVLL